MFYRLEGEETKESTLYVILSDIIVHLMVDRVYTQIAHCISQGLVRVE